MNLKLALISTSLVGLLFATGCGCSNTSTPDTTGSLNTDSISSNMSNLDYNDYYNSNGYTNSDYYNMNYNDGYNTSTSSYTDTLGNDISTGLVAMSNDILYGTDSYGYYNNEYNNGYSYDSSYTNPNDYNNSTSYTTQYDNSFNASSLENNTSDAYPYVSTSDNVGENKSASYTSVTEQSTMNS